MVLNDTFNNTLVIPWRYVLLVGETGDPGENQQPAASRGQTLSHNVVSRTPLLAGCELTTLVVIGTDCIGSCKPNYLTIMTDCPYSDTTQYKYFGYNARQKYLYLALRNV